MWTHTGTRHPVQCSLVLCCGPDLAQQRLWESACGRRMWEMHAGGALGRCIHDVQHNCAIWSVQTVTSHGTGSDARAVGAAPLHEVHQGVLSRDSCNCLCFRGLQHNVLVGVGHAGVARPHSLNGQHCCSLAPCRILQWWCDRRCPDAISQVALPGKLYNTGKTVR